MKFSLEEPIAFAMDRTIVLSRTHGTLPDYEDSTPKLVVRDLSFLSLLLVFVFTQLLDRVRIIRTPEGYTSLNVHTPQYLGASFHKKLIIIIISSTKLTVYMCRLPIYVFSSPLYAPL